jgi:hypothetical protein
MKTISVALILVGILSGCTTSPIPTNYSGPIATVQDNATADSGHRAEFFFLSEIDGRRIDNILTASVAANWGKGFSVEIVPFQRQIPAKTVTVKIQGRVKYGAPIQELLNAATLYTVERTIVFTPASNKTYAVFGRLTADQRTIWLLDTETQKDVETGQRID